MLNIINNIAEIVEANIADLLERCKDPEKMAKMYLRRYKQDYLPKIQDETATAMAYEKAAESKVKRSEEKIKELTIYAEKAVKSKDEDGARDAIERKLEENAFLESYKENLAACRENVQKLRQMYDKLKADIEYMENRKYLIESNFAAAKAETHIYEVSGKLAGKINVEETFDKYEDASMYALAKSKAIRELNDPTDTLSVLKKKYGPISSDAVENELARIKNGIETTA